MDPFEKKAYDWLHKNLPIYNGVLTNSVIRLLKEQDKETRHACAEAVLECSSKTMTGNLIQIGEAHAACINAKPKPTVNMPADCECDDTHENNKIVCQACWTAGYRYETAWWNKENK